MRRIWKWFRRRNCRRNRLVRLNCEFAGGTPALPVKRVQKRPGSCGVGWRGGCLASGESEDYSSMNGGKLYAQTGDDGRGAGSPPAQAGGPLGGWNDRRWRTRRGDLESDQPEWMAVWLRS